MACFQASNLWCGFAGIILNNQRGLCLLNVGVPFPFTAHRSPLTSRHMNPNQPDDAARWRETGIRHRQQGRLAEAVEAFERALESAPADAPTLSELAHALRRQGKADDARRAAARAVEIAPGMAGAWFNLGAALCQQRDTARGIEAYRKALELAPNFAEAWSNLGGALADTGDGPGAIEAYRRAVAANPQLTAAWSNLGNALLEGGQIADAVGACRRATEIEPGFAGAWSNLGNALNRQGEHAAAVRACERALALEPDLAGAWGILGSALMDLGELDKACAAHRRVLAAEPLNALTHYYLGLAQERSRQHAAAEDSYRRAVDIDPEFAAAGVRLACALLMRGELRAGWAEHEWRWRGKNAAPKRFNSSPWTGEKSPGLRLLVWGEQGLGDEIIYSKMLGELADAGMRVTAELDRRLVPLVQRSFPEVRVVARKDPAAVDAAAFDFECPIGDLGRWLRTSFAAFPRHAGYLQADAARARAFSKKLRSGGAHRVVGISWCSANREFGASKSSALADWAGVLSTPGIRFLDLQFGDTADAREALRRGHGLQLAHLDDVDLLNDIEAVAAMCAACDLVITVSNVTAHLAGALGRPVWLLAPNSNGRLWYWFANRTDSPWYPSMRIFPQQAQGDWREILDTIARELPFWPAAKAGSEP